MKYLATLCRKRGILLLLLVASSGWGAEVDPKVIRTFEVLGSSPSSSPPLLDVKEFAAALEKSLGASNLVLRSLEVRSLKPAQKNLNAQFTFEKKGKRYAGNCKLRNDPENDRYVMDLDASMLYFFKACRLVRIEPSQKRVTVHHSEIVRSKQLLFPYSGTIAEITRLDKLLEETHIQFDQLQYRLKRNSGAQSDTDMKLTEAVRKMQSVKELLTGLDEESGVQAISP